MKRIILNSIFVISLLIVGCSDQSSIVGPSQQINQTLNKTPISLNLTALNKTITVSKEINGDVGGLITIEGNLSNTLSLNGSLSIPAGSFKGTKNITVTLDNNTASFEFGPSGVFDKPLTFNMTFMGVDLNGINPNDVVFAYASPNGTSTLIENEGITTDVSTGTLAVNNAQLKHFSRYYWGK